MESVVGEDLSISPANSHIGENCIMSDWEHTKCDLIEKLAQLLVDPRPSAFGLCLDDMDDIFLLLF